MRKTQSYQEPTVRDMKGSSISNSHEFQRQTRMSEGDFYSLRNSQQSQPLFEIKQNPNCLQTTLGSLPPKSFFTKPKMFQDLVRNGNGNGSGSMNGKEENELVKSLNMQPQSSTFKMIQKQNPVSARGNSSTNVGEESRISRQSFAELGRSRMEEVEGLLFSKHLNKIQRGQASELKLSYKLSFGVRSAKGHSSNVDKVNQDSFIINLNLDKGEKVNFFGVCDGHGPLGHHVSAFLKNHLTEANKTLNYRGRIKQQICEMLKKTDQRLNESKIDLQYSGSTMVGLYVCADRIYCANVGDSRAIIGSKAEGDWSVWQISTDHKPSLKSEADRIAKRGGRIEAAKGSRGEPVGPLRVWLRGEESPGIAMTRSFGDKLAQRVGVHSQPQITQHFLSDSDRIVLVASDGVWEFLANQEILRRLVPYYEKNHLQEACTFLQNYARSQWQKKNNGEIDDISFILIFLTHN